MSADVSDIKQIIEVYGSQVNKYLAEGWVVLSIANGKDEHNSPLIIYSLGHKDATARRSIY